MSGRDGEQDFGGRDLSNEPSRSSTLSASASAVRAGLPILPTLTILAHPDPGRVGEVARLEDLALGESQELSRHHPPFGPPGRAGARPLLDRHLSRKPIRLVPGAIPGEVRIVPAESRTRLEIDGIGAQEPVVVEPGRMQRGVALVLASRIVLLLHLSDPTPAGRLPRFGLVGDSSAMIRLRREIARAARLEVPVLLRGETGTGKELVAHALHRAGPRRHRPFLAVNLGAVAPNLAAAELFGAVRGAFTGADRARKGVFEMADGGTLFLDEVGEASAEVRSALLRVLETGEVQAVGDGRPRRVDVRLLTATDRDLEAAIEDGAWNAALLHRLAGWEIRLPPLRERLDDLGRLLHHFVALELDRHRPSSPFDARSDGDGESDGESDGEARVELRPRTVAALARHSWPGNVRELRNVARELAVAAFDGGAQGPQVRRIENSLVQQSGRHRALGGPEAAPGSGSLGSAARSTRGSAPRRGAELEPRRQARKPSEIPHDELVAVLEAHRFRLKDAAAALGISRTSLYRSIELAPDLQTAAELTDAAIDEARRQVGDELDDLARALRVSPEALRRRLAVGG